MTDIILESRRRRVNANGRVVTLLIVLGFLSAVAVVWTWVLDPPDGSIPSSFGKAAIQVLGVAVVGTAVGIAVKARDERRDDRRRRDDFLRSVLDRTVASYHSVKRTRRLLEAAMDAEGDERQISIAVYDKYMNDLIDPELEFETLRRIGPMVDSQLSLMRPRGQPNSSNESRFKSLAQNVENYLDRVIDEYQKRRPEVAHQSVVPLASLDHLHEFVEDTKQFRLGTTDNVNTMISLLNGALVSST